MDTSPAGTSDCGCDGGTQDLTATTWGTGDVSIPGLTRSVGALAGAVTTCGCDEGLGRPGQTFGARLAGLTGPNTEDVESAPSGSFNAVFSTCHAPVVA